MTRAHPALEVKLRLNASLVFRLVFASGSDPAALLFFLFVLAGEI
jgi:hypothetical protein